MISRRALFGLSVGAVAAAKGLPAAAQTRRVIGLDFGNPPAMMFKFSKGRVYYLPCGPNCNHTQKWIRENSRLIDDAEFSHVERGLE